MTPSGPILGLNKRWKIKLRSKLQPACSRAVYQQCVRNQREKKTTRGGMFFYSSAVVLNFCWILFSFESAEDLWGGQVWSSVFSLFSGKTLSKRGDDLRWDIQVREPEERLAPLLEASLSGSPSAVPYICTRGGRWHESGSPSFILSESLKFAATVNTSAAASNHSHNGPRLLLLSATFEWPSER